jgi:Nucleotidyltransferase domain
MPVNEALGSAAHQALIAHVAAHYAGDDRIRAVAVFGSVSTGTWHELSDVDFDVVTRDGAGVEPGAEIAALFGSRAVIVLAGADAADVVLDSREELSIRWHPLGTTSPNIAATVRVVAGVLSTADLVAAGAAHRGPPDEPRRLDAIVRDAIYARKALARGQRWAAVAAVERIRWSLTDLRGRRDGLRLDPADPAQALATVLAEVRADYDLGPRRRALLGDLARQFTRPPRGTRPRCPLVRSRRPAARAAAAGP